MARIHYVAYIILFFYVPTAFSQLQTVNGTINIMVGTTSGCRVAARFMTQVRATYDKYKEFVNFEFVPWGRTRRHDNGTLTCMFGENDCWANRVQRCALNLLRGNAEAQLQYIECESTEPFAAFQEQSFRCAQTVGLSIIDLDMCISTAAGDALEGPAEEVSREAEAVIFFVPFIVFNNVVNLALRTQALQRLESVVCFALSEDPTTGVTHCRI